MDSQRIGYAVGALLVAGVLVALAVSTGAITPLLGDGYDAAQSATADAEGDSPIHDDYEHTAVTIRDGDTGAELGNLEAAIADTFQKRYLGLSATDDLPANRGMLFIHDSSGAYTYVMRNMSFGIDIVFIDADGRITTIHNAPKPGPDEDGNEQAYTGEGNYVLEVTEGWMAEHDVEVGDEAVFDL